MAKQSRPRLVVAGASGFIGSAVCRALCRDYDIVALTRSSARARLVDPDLPITWRLCDLFSLTEVQEACAGAEYAIYLVHSMLPSSRLTQAKPADMDLLLADNFAHGASRHGIRQIIYVGGVMPEGFEISRLLWSRREVEMTLASRGTAVTALRADLVVGPGGSSLKMLVDLVRRLPVLALPPAARSRTCPIALDDLLRAISYCLGNPDTYAKHFDIGGPQALSYEAIIAQTAAVIGKKPLFFTLPWLPLWLVAAVARWVSDAPGVLVQSLIESLAHDALIEDNPVQRAIAPAAIPYRHALAASLDATGKTLAPNPRGLIREQDDADLHDARLVRSIQRIVLPPGQDAEWVAGNYFRWLPRLLWPFVGCDFDAKDSCTIYVRFPRLRLLTLTVQPELCSVHRRIYYITGGFLARGDSPRQGRFEFRDVLGHRYTIAAVQDFAPRLPWYFYNMTQAIAHLAVMRIYQRRLAALAR